MITSGMHLLLAMIAPFSSPQAAPVSSPPSTATAVGMPLSSATYITTALSTMMLPMERSIPPEISSMLMAMVKMPSTLICWKMVMMLPIPMNLGLMNETMTTMATITMASSVRWSRSSFFAREGFLSAIFLHS